MTTNTRAVVVERPGAPFVVQDVTLDDVGPGEVLVRMVAAGLCHTDLGVQAGGIPFALPGILGHEGAGVVEEVGDGVTHVRPGDHVLLSFTSCGTCLQCRGGHPAYCATWVPDNLITGVRRDGTPTVTRNGEPVGGNFFGQSSFAVHALADERSVIRVEDDIPLEYLAPLGCSVQTGFGTVWNVLAPEPGSTLVVFGVGAVGLSAIMAAALLPLTAVVAVDRLEGRLALAKELGATHVVNADTEDVAATVLAATGEQGADHAVDTTAAPAIIRTAIDTLAVRGTCAVVGAPPAGTEAAFDVQGLLPGKQVVGVTLGDGEPRTLLPQLVELYRGGKLPMDRLVRHYGLEELDQAAADMRAGVTVKPVVRIGSSRQGLQCAAVPTHGGYA